MGLWKARLCCGECARARWPLWLCEAAADTARMSAGGSFSSAVATRPLPPSPPSAAAASASSSASPSRCSRSPSPPSPPPFSPAPLRCCCARLLPCCVDAVVLAYAAMRTCVQMVRVGYGRGGSPPVSSRSAALCWW